MSQSFSQSAKSEICSCGKFNRTCCKRAMLYGMVLFSSHYNPKEYALKATHTLTVTRLTELAHEVCGVDLSISVSNARNDAVYRVSCDEEDATVLFNEFDNIKAQPSLRINRAVFECDICRYAFITGAFLASGTITAPDKAYHLEFVSSHTARTRDLLDILGEITDGVHMTQRGSLYVVYVKESAVIEDLLTIMGAKNCVFDIMNTKIVKDIRNRANRAANCETANMGKTVAAAVVQKQAIEKLIDTGKIDEIDDVLKSVAVLRMENEDFSLNQLVPLTNPPLSKSALNRKLKKLVELAEV